MERKYVISCSLFDKISSDKKGTVLNVENGDVKLSHCSFSEITSSSFPGVLFGSTSNISLSNNIFVLCHANGNNEKYGRVCYFNQCNVKIHYFSSEFCGNDQNQGDSTVSIFNSILKCSFVNSSFCTGSQDGSGSLSIWYNQIASTISYLNVISCYELASFEVAYSKKLLIASKSNFINGSKCVAIVSINCDSELKECVFENMPSRFNGQSVHVKLVNCISDKIFEGYTFNTITSSVTLTFKVKIQSCRYMTSQKNCIHLQIPGHLHCLQSLFILFFASI